MKNHAGYLLPAGKAGTDMCVGHLLCCSYVLWGCVLLQPLLQQTGCLQVKIASLLTCRASHPGMSCLSKTLARALSVTLAHVHTLQCGEVSVPRGSA